MSIVDWGIFTEALINFFHYETEGDVIPRDPNSALGAFSGVVGIKVIVPNHYPGPQNQKSGWFGEQADEKVSFYQLNIRGPVYQTSKSAKPLGCLSLMWDSLSATIVKLTFEWSDT